MGVIRFIKARFTLEAIFPDSWQPRNILVWDSFGRLHADAWKRNRNVSVWLDVLRDFDLAIFKSEYYVSECKFSGYLCVHRPAIPNTLNNRSGNMYVPENIFWCKPCRMKDVNRTVVTDIRLGLSRNQSEK